MIYLGKFHHDLFATELAGIMASLEIIPFYGPTIQVSEILQYIYITIYDNLPRFMFHLMTYLTQTEIFRNQRLTFSSTTD